MDKNATIDMDENVDGWVFCRRFYYDIDSLKDKKTPDRFAKYRIRLVEDIIREFRDSDLSLDDFMLDVAIEYGYYLLVDCPDIDIDLLDKYLGPLNIKKLVEYELSKPEYDEPLQLY